MTQAAHSLPIADACWGTSGVRGDRSCPELATVVHCHNCKVFRKAAQAFLDRAVDAAYLEERARFVGEPAQTYEHTEVSSVVFELGDELFALESRAIVEVTERRRIHHVPHRTNAVFAGLANVQGRLELCFSLAGLLGVPPAASGSADAARMIVVELSQKRWVLQVDKVRGAERFAEASIKEPPASSTRSSNQYVRALLVRGDARIGLLDQERLNAGLERSLK
jgi:chemotaxis-related protein WspD